MFEPKSSKQNEQKSVYSQISSPEVGENDAKVSRILSFVQSDTRNKSEIFESLKQRILNDAAGELDEQQAIEATRNLLNFFESAFKAADGELSNNVDLPCVNGNVDDENNTTKSMR
ncbi:MAG: hypothetical protein MK052_11670 [Alphaproteobacteria bacterium]|nr:hypothetical protein [Alphaproteobacteria bacterium]